VDNEDFEHNGMQELKDFIYPVGLRNAEELISKQVST
jgi:hypothetical protein